MKNKLRFGQTTTEYVLGLVVILAAMLGSNFIGKANEALDSYFVRASNKMSNESVDSGHIVNLSSCSGVNTRYDLLKARLDSVSGGIDSLNESADYADDNITSEAVDSAVSGIRQGANYYTQSANDQAALAATEEANYAADTNTANTYEAELPGMRANYTSSGCAGCESQYPWIPEALNSDPPGYVDPAVLSCYNLYNDISFRETEIPRLRTEAENHRVAALGYRAEEARMRDAAQEYTDQTDSVQDQADLAHDNAEEMNTAGDDYGTEVEKLQAQMNSLKTEYPACFVETE